MSQLVFLVDEHPDGHYTARALGVAIFTAADSLEELRENVRDAVRCHFADDHSRPVAVHLHRVHDEVITL